MGKKMNFKCPICGGAMYKNERSYGCGNWRTKDGGCHVSVWREIFRHEVTDDEARKILEGDAIGPVHLKCSTGEKTGYIYFDKDIKESRVRFSDDAKPTGSRCPVCGKEVLEAEKYYRCTDYKRDEGCPVIIWKNCFGHEITLGEARELLQGQEIGPLKLTFKSGKTGTGCLYFNMDEGCVRFRFPEKGEL